MGSGLTVSVFAYLTSKLRFISLSVGQQKTLMLVHPHSKEVLRAAIRSDAEFLSRSNIMDYS